MYAERHKNEVDESVCTKHNKHPYQAVYDLFLALVPRFCIRSLIDELKDTKNKDEECDDEHKSDKRIQNYPVHFIQERSDSDNGCQNGLIKVLVRLG